MIETWNVVNPSSSLPVGTVDREVRLWGGGQRRREQAKAGL
jgi:hypothetical protein